MPLSKEKKWSLLQVCALADSGSVNGPYLGEFVDVGLEALGVRSPAWSRTALTTRAEACMCREPALRSLSVAAGTGTALLVAVVGEDSVTEYFVLKCLDAIEGQESGQTDPPDTPA